MDEGIDVYKEYTKDLVTLLREDSFEAKKARDKEKTGYSQGYLAAMRDVVSLVKQQAQSFQIEEIISRLDDLDPERDLT